MATLDKTRAIDNLEITINVVSRALALENREAPRKYIGEEYTSMLMLRITTLESLKPGLDSEYKENSEFLLEKANKLLKKVEYSYL